MKTSSIIHASLEGSPGPPLKKTNINGGPGVDNECLHGGFQFQDLKIRNRPVI